jgi:hypothetical protein
LITPCTTVSVEKIVLFVSLGQLARSNSDASIELHCAPAGGVTVTVIGIVYPATALTS